MKTAASKNIVAVTKVVEEQIDPALVKHVAMIVASMQAGPSAVASSEVSGLITDVWKSLSRVGTPIVEEIVEEVSSPAVPIKKSVFQDFIVCLEDGKHLKMLKRYIRSRFNLSPEQYRKKWGLPADYPMTAPAYSQKRSALAKQIGLGLGGRRTAQA